MSTLVGLVVAVDKYANPDLERFGPCISAIRFTQWLLDLDFVNKQLYLFVKTDDPNLQERLQELEKLGVHIGEATDQEVDDFIREKLEKCSPVSPATFVFYCCGHGFESGGNRRVFLLSDFSDQRNDRIIEVTRLEHRLQRRWARLFPSQFIFCDMCAGSRRGFEETAGDEPVKPRLFTHLASGLAG